jgi:hypothetical protein
VAKDFMRFVPKASSLRRALRSVFVGGVVATTGLPATASTTTPIPAETLSIVDRSRKAAKLVLRLPGSAANLSAQHRSHRSHSSHSSHYSGSGGGTAAPRVAPPPVSAPSSPPPTTLAGTLPLSGATTSSGSTPVKPIAGEVVSVDRATRTFVFKITGSVSRTIAYRDDTKFETDKGASIRFDDFASAASGRVPISQGDKVELIWQVSPTSPTPTAVTIKRKTQQ